MLLSRSCRLEETASITSPLYSQRVPHFKLKTAAAANSLQLHRLQPSVCTASWLALVPALAVPRCVRIPMPRLWRSTKNSHFGRIRMNPLYVLIPATALFTGCASVVNDVTHPIKVETKTEAGELITGAECILTNERAAITIKSGEIANVRRSNTDLKIECKHPNNSNASATATSRVNGGMFGNILLGGGVGAIIDHNRGTAYTYPTWVQLIFGRVLAFDRRDEKDGFPAPPVSVPVASK